MHGVRVFVEVADQCAQDVGDMFQQPTLPQGRQLATHVINGLIERGRRITRGFSHFDHYRIRSLVIAGDLDASPHTQP